MRGQTRVALAKALAGTLTGALALAACATSESGVPRPAPLPAAGSTASYTQTASGMVFPGAVGDFERERLARFADDGTDEAANYGRTSPAGEEVLATVYVYVVPPETYAGVASSPTAEQVCALHFVETAQTIAVMNPEAELIGQEQLDLVQGDATYTGRKVTLGISEGFLKEEDVPLRTELYLFCGFAGDWMVKYRFTYRADYDASEAIADFMRDLTLSIGEQTPGGAVGEAAVQAG